MNEWSDILAPLVGRILLGGYFLWTGIISSLNFPSLVGNIAQSGVSAPIAVSIIFILIQVLGGCAVVVGWQTRIASLVLASYTLVTTLAYLNFNDEAQFALFLQSFAVVGGLLYLSAYKNRPRPGRFL